MSEESPQGADGTYSDSSMAVARSLFGCSLVLITGVLLLIVLILII